jgi:hypothetical protein
MAQVILSILVDSATNPSADRKGGRFILSDDPYAVVPGDSDLIAFAGGIDWEPLFGSDYASTDLAGLSIEGQGREITIP